MITVNMASDQLQRTGTNIAVDPEPVTGLNIISDPTRNGHISEKPTALVEIDHNLVPNLDSNSSIDNKSESKKVSVVEPNKDFSEVDKNLEMAVTEREEKEDGLKYDIDGTDMQMEISGKKKNKNKKKPKGQRGLV